MVTALLLTGFGIWIQSGGWHQVSLIVHWNTDGRLRMGCIAPVSSPSSCSWVLQPEGCPWLSPVIGELEGLGVYASWLFLLFFLWSYSCLFLGVFHFFLEVCTVSDNGIPLVLSSGVEQELFRC